MSEGMANKTQDPRDSREHLREIRSVLYGHLTVGPDKRLAVAKNMLGNPWGLTDGAPETFLFGVMRRSYVYESPKRERIRIHYETGKMLGRIGRSLYLETAPDHPACLVKHFFFRPVVLELAERQAEGGSETVLYAYSGRSFFSLLSILRTVSVFEKHMPKQMARQGRKDGSDAAGIRSAPVMPRKKQ
ncbi:MAG: hypothetical protein IJ825_10440 [Oscillospiraceae bacterium]|nr:hypothetical protein [Oscillospiraceae bacterium]